MWKREKRGMEEIACRLPSVPGWVYWNTKGWQCWCSFTCCWEPSPLPSLSSDLSSIFKSVKHKREKLLNILAQTVSLWKVQDILRLKHVSWKHLFHLLSKPLVLFKSFIFFPTFVIWTQVNLILTVKPTLIYLLPWLLFSNTSFTNIIHSASAIMVFSSSPLKLCSEVSSIL